MDSSAFAIRFLDFGGTSYVDGAITQEVLDKLLQRVRRGSVSSFLLSLDQYGEEDFFHADIENGWAALNFNTWDEEGESHMQVPVNPDFSDSEEEAPVSIGGQTPVLKRNALNDLNLAAECVLHFAKTGELYPHIQWEEWSGAL